MGVTFDGPNKRIICTAGTVALDVRDVYSRWKDWMLESDNAKWAPAFRVVGGDPVGGGNYVSSYFFLLNGWRVRPQEANHTLVITGSLVVDGGGDPTVTTLGSYRVLVQYSVPVKAEAIGTGGGGGTVDMTQVQTALDAIDAKLDTIIAGGGGGGLTAEQAAQLEQAANGRSGIPHI